MINKGLFSSLSDEWGTPQDIYEQLNSEFCFTLDPCASLENYKCEKFFTKSDDGLSKSWAGERVFCNPPYSNIAKWVKKAYYETSNFNTLVVLLIPARTDTRYFHDFIYHNSEIRFIKGRLKFVQNGKNDRAPFPSMIVIFRSSY